LPLAPCPLKHQQQNGKKGKRRGAVDSATAKDEGPASSNGED
jgi:hypothetical protein